MAKVFSIANQKGGVGKTTTTVNLGAGLARLGIPTLIVDLDAQANHLARAAYVAAAIADASVHTLVLRGAGRHFCTGLDLSDLATLSDGDLLLRLVRIETLLAGYPDRQPEISFHADKASLAMRRWLKRQAAAEALSRGAG